MHAGSFALVLAAVAVAAAHFITPKFTATDNKRSLIIPCSPHMGVNNHGAMPYNLRTGWWYLTCNANAEGYTGEIGLEFVVFETWLNVLVIKNEILMSHAAISLPSEAAGHRFHSYVQFAKKDELDWYKTPINVATQNTSLIGDLNGWTAGAYGKSQQTNETFSFELAARWGKNSVLMGHSNDTGCVTYNLLTPTSWDVFYTSVLSYDLLGQDKSSQSRIRLPGETQWRALNGTCHYDRQHATVASTGNWQWGQGTFAKSLPAAYERLQGAHLVWWALFTGTTKTQLSGCHVGIKHRDRALEEFDSANVTILNKRTEPRYNTTFAYDVLIVLKSLGWTLRVTATVPEAVVPVALGTATGGFASDMTYMESPCEYRIGTSLDNTVVGTGYMEVTSSETPINVPTDGIEQLISL